MATPKYYVPNLARSLDSKRMTAEQLAAATDLSLESIKIVLDYPERHSLGMPIVKRIERVLADAPEPIKVKRFIDFWH